MIDRRFRIEAQHFVEAGIDHCCDAIDCQRCLGDVGGQDHFPARRRRESALLRVDIERTVERKNDAVHIAQLAGSHLDLPRSWQKREDVAGRLADGRTQQCVRTIGDADRMRSRVDFEHAGVAEETGDFTGIEGRGHHHDAEVVTRVEGLLRQREREVGVDAALVEFVEHDDVEVAQQRIGLQSRGEDAFGGHQELGSIGEALFEADLPSDLFSDTPAALFGDPPRERACRHPPRLQKDRLADLRQSWRDSCRLPRSRRGDDHRGAVRPHVRFDFSDVGIDRERRLHHTALWRTKTISITPRKGPLLHTRRMIRPTRATTKPRIAGRVRTASAKAKAECLERPAAARTAGACTSRSGRSSKPSVVRTKSSQLLLQPAELLADRLETTDQLRVILLVFGGTLAFDDESPSRLEDARLHFVKTFEALASHHRLQLWNGDQLPGQFLFADASIFDQHRRFSLHDLIETPVAEEETDDDVVHEQKRERADESAGDGVVVTDDGVLHRVRQRQQHHEIEWIQLRQLALAEDAQEQHQEDIDQNRAQHLLRDGHGQHEHISNDVMHSCHHLL